MIGGERAVDQILVEQADPERFVAELLLGLELAKPTHFAVGDAGDGLRETAVDQRGHIDKTFVTELAAGRGPFRRCRKRLEQFDTLGARTQLQAGQGRLGHPAEIGPVHMPEQAAKLVDLLLLRSGCASGSICHGYGGSLQEANRNFAAYQASNLGIGVVPNWSQSYTLRQG